MQEQCARKSRPGTPRRHAASRRVRSRAAAAARVARRLMPTARSSARRCTTPSSAPGSPTTPPRRASGAATHRRRRTARGRDGARPRLGRRHRRAPLRPPRRPDGGRLRPRHDRGDARARAAEQAARRASTNVHFLRGEIEDVPLPAESVDVVISNCVINLSATRRRCCARSPACSSRAAGSAISDVVAEDRLSPESGPSEAPGWAASPGALAVRVRPGLEAAGLEDVEVPFTHEVADGMHAAIGGPSSRVARGAAARRRGVRWVLLGVGGRSGLSRWRKKPPARTRPPTTMNESARATELSALRS